MRCHGRSLSARALPAPGALNVRDLRGRTAAVTGAASGIGRALAVRLAGAGTHLALADIDEPGLAETAGTVRALRPDVHVTTHRVDVADRAAVHAWADAAAAEHGTVNLVVNNAGVSCAGTADAMPYEDLDWIVGINLWGVIHGTKAFLPHLRAAGEGHVVNVSSLFGLVAQPAMSAYNASKFAVRGYTEALRQDLLLEGAPIGVTCVHPGGIRTAIAATSRVAGSTPFGDGDASRERFERLFLRIAPDTAARAILRGVVRGRARVLIGREAFLLDVLQRLAPSGYQVAVVRGIERLAAR